MKKIKYLFIVLLAVVLDQLSKHWIVSNFDLFESHVIIDNFLSITYVRNTGAGFSILEGKMLFFYVITIISMVVLGYLFVKSDEKDYLQRISISMIVGGALGNFIDRLLMGYVVDFISVLIFGYNFPVFNIADSFLTIGAILFVLSILKEERYGKTRI